MHQGERRAALPGLTALRFFAATYVLLFHLFPVPATSLLHPNLMQRLVGAGFTGVSCFFILSGFILAYTHPTVPRPGVFYWARFARIYPLYLFALLLALPNFIHGVVRFGPRWGLWAIPADLLLIQSWVPTLALAVNTPAWTLSTEAFFYALFPFLIAQRWLRPRRPMLLLLGLWALQLLPPVLAETFLVPKGNPHLTTLVYDVLFLPLFRLGEFVAGAVLGLMFTERQARHPAAATPSGNTGSQWLLPAGLFASLGLLSLNLWLPHVIVRNGLLLGPFCLLIWALAVRSGSFLASRPLQIGGEISYGIYILQQPYGHVAYSLLSRTPLRGLPEWVVVLLLFPFAWICYLGVEKPCRRWLLQHGPGTDRTSGAANLAKPLPTPQSDLP